MDHQHETERVLDAIEASAGPPGLSVEIAERIRKRRHAAGMFGPVTVPLRHADGTTTYEIVEVNP